ncbi:MAG: hypothetical protein P3T54_08150 [Dehalogenimonas sp.]|uniref:DUF308 domain-containing protein n=1 Tax=Candidatus Dehalogenimonas loeffleri TaxID=3127115 RepID=A0ABZ2J400_9CHLR|nr:hypothetical protein [Dehalogenimonas sp.]
MKTALRFAAWGGMLIVISGLVWAFSSSYTLTTTGQLGSGVGFLMTAVIALLGAVLALVGGFKTQPRFFGVAAIIAGIFYIASFYGKTDFPVSFLASPFEIAPALGLIVGGVIVTFIGKNNAPVKNDLVIDGVALIITGLAIGVFLAVWAVPYNLIAAVVLISLGGVTIYQAVKTATRRRAVTPGIVNK